MTTAHHTASPITSSEVASCELLPDELTLHLIASGLILLTQQARTSVALTLPYPAPLQRGLNRLVLTCLRRTRPPPHDLMELLDWCHRPLLQWGLELPDGCIRGDETLLHEQIPTATCESWARTGSDVAAEVSEERLLLHVMDVCKRANAPDSYTAFRRLLIEQPVMTAFEYQLALAQPALDLLADELRLAYEPAPAAALQGGRLATCAVCGNLLLLTKHDTLVCEDEVCRTHGPLPPKRTCKVHEELVWLRRDLRRYIAAPGRAELRLAEHLTHLGLQVELWPMFDRYDVRITFPDQTIWALDVKDWSNPFLLARNVNRKAFPVAPPWHQAFFVFPDARKTQRSDYLRAFTNTCHLLSDRISACFERELLRRVSHHLQGGNDA